MQPTSNSLPGVLVVFSVHLYFLRSHAYFHNRGWAPILAFFVTRSSYSEHRLDTWNITKWWCPRDGQGERLKQKPVPVGPRIWEVAGPHFSFPSYPLHNYSLPSVPNLSHRPSPSPHTFNSWHFLPHIMLLSVIFKPSFSLLLISFTLFTFPRASYWIFLL